MRKLMHVLATAVVLLLFIAGRPATAQVAVADVGNAPLHIMNTCKPR